MLMYVRTNDETPAFDGRTKGETHWLMMVEVSEIIIVVVISHRELSWDYDDDDQAT